MAYLAWRVVVGLNLAIQIDFMRVGHTRCFVDAGSGLLKQKYCRSDVDTVQQIEDVVKTSASINEAETFSWEWREWDKFFERHFRRVKNITSHQRFCFSSSNPGSIALSNSDKHPDVTFRILSAATIADSGLNVDTLPPILAPTDKSDARVKYLYQHIRQFCHEENRDITCPAPAGAGSSDAPEVFE